MENSEVNIPLVGDGSENGGKGRKKQGVSVSTAVEESIMGTNDGSIVSKRSVERLYLPEPHFLRYFVKKPKRRPPMINRGYWLRMKVVEDGVQEILRDYDTRPKVVVNLGCGYDPLPFNILSRTPVQGGQVLFVDVDYSPLMKNKLAMIQASPAITSLLNDTKIMPSEDVLLHSSEYVALACDLSDLSRLSSLLGRLCNVQNVSICFVAEISVSYMEASDADRLIRWAAEFGNARFIFLEQCLPWGNQHPYAVAMLNAFAKLRKRSGYLEEYSTIDAQKQRFLDLGWSEVNADSLWRKWSDPAFASSEERHCLDKVEPFDEWEEFALFGQHCFILTATTRTLQTFLVETVIDRANAQNDRFAGDISFSALSVESDVELAPVPPRNFGILFKSEDGVLYHHGGYGSQSRLATTQIYHNRQGSLGTEDGLSLTAIGEKVTHTVSHVGETNYLIVGGRKSPKDALRECWLRSKGKWHRSESLPFGLYRHCAVSLSLEKSINSNIQSDDYPAKVLVFGGKTGPAEISDEWLLWSFSRTSDSSNCSHGHWTRLKCLDNPKPLLFGASMALLPSHADDDVCFEGLLMGGMTSDGVVSEKVFVWSLDTDKMTVSIKPFECLWSHQLARFGAQVAIREASVPSSGFYLVGGIADANKDTKSYVPILSVHFESSNDNRNLDSSTQVKICPFGDGNEATIMPQHAPLLIGHAVISIEPHEVADHVSGLFIVGGGANCFTFGAVHNEAAYFLQKGKLTKNPFITLSQAAKNQIKRPTENATTTNEDESRGQQSTLRMEPKSNQVQVISEAINFQQVVQQAEPKILRGLDVGRCTKLWTADYLKAQLGAEKVVSVHHSENDVMDFQNKNFSYRKMPLGEFLDAIRDGGKHYLRALSSESTDKPAMFWHDYPEISDEFRIPKELSNVILGQTSQGQERVHSAVLRLSGPVSMWLHYDVMANVLCQVKGGKRLLLFPPSDVSLLGVPPGQSSSSLNMFDPATYKSHTALGKCRPLEAHLRPGDVLFIPALWLHTAQPVDEMSMAVNIFFRDLDSGYATGRDAYGNRDLEVYEEGRRRIKRMAERFATIPKSARQFYLSRLAQELHDLSEA